jgi:hypothetical protein
MPKQGTSLRNVTIVALAAASLSLPLAAHAQTTDPNVRAIEQGTPVPVPVQPGAMQGDPNINAITNSGRPLYNSVRNPGELSSDPNIRAIEQGTPVPVPVQPGPGQGDPNINAITNQK